MESYVYEYILYEDIDLDILEEELLEEW